MSTLVDKADFDPIEWREAGLHRAGTHRHERIRPSGTRRTRCPVYLFHAARVAIFIAGLGCFFNELHARHGLANGTSPEWFFKT